MSMSMTIGSATNVGVSISGSRLYEYNQRDKLSQFSLLNFSAYFPLRIREGHAVVAKDCRKVIFFHFPLFFSFWG